MKIKALIKRICPPAVIQTYRLLQALECERRLAPLKRELFGNDAAMVPPLRQMYDGPADYQIYKENGEEFFGFYKELCGLKPKHRVLDIGSGNGRKTIPLTHYLDSSGRYEGMDINSNGVEWCQTHISSKFKNFNFQRIDVYSKTYNPQGKIDAASYRFPYADKSFDLITLTSVFTHMVPDSIRQYLGEVHRMLKPDRKALITFLLLNEDSIALMDRGKGYSLKYDWNGCRVLDPEEPEHLIAQPEELILQLMKECHLEATKLDYGSWSGREKFLSYQDIIICQRKV